jgi:hypothetical protein
MLCISQPSVADGSLLFSLKGTKLSLLPCTGLCKLHSSFLMWELQFLHRNFWFTLVRNMLATLDKNRVYQGHYGGQLVLLHKSVDCQVAQQKMVCAIYHVAKISRCVKQNISAKCHKCDMEMHVIKGCSEEYHNKAKLQNFELNLPMQNSASYWNKSKRS